MACLSQIKYRNISQTEKALWSEENIYESTRTKTYTHFSKFYSILELSGSFVKHSEKIEETTIS
jgi:hypothetical protein